MPRRQTVPAIGAACLLLALAATSPAVEPSARPDQVARVFVLAGQSNMEGQAVVDLAGPDYNDGKGTIAALMRHPDNAARLAWLRDADGTWRTRDDVFVRYEREQEPLLAGPLGIGYAVYGGTHHFGAELAFGKIVGDFFAARGEPVLLVKTAWGGKSLFADFRPPSAGATADAEGRAVPAPGPYYTRMIAEVKKALAAVPEIVPGATRGELAGFVWWHGWNDGVDPERSVPAYEDNLAALLRDVRRDLDAPELPVVIGELTGPWVDAPEEWEALRRSQRLVAGRDEFRDHARFVGTRTFVRASEDSPNPGHGHHEFGNAETYLLVGEALGRGMVSLLSGEPVAPTPPYAHGPVPDDAALPGQPTGRSEIGLVGYWSFDEGVGTAVHDQSASGADGQITGATWVKGILGSALEFDGVDDFVNVRLPGSGVTDKAITVEAWIQPTGSNVHANLVCAGPESLDFGMWIQGGRLVGGLWSSTGTQFSATSAGGPTPGRWCHVAMTCDVEAGKTVTLYVNGIPNGTIAATGTAIRSGHATIDIGGRTPNAWHFRGLIDEVKVYNRVLGAEELRGRYDDYLKRRAAEIDVTAYKNSPRIWTGNPEDRTASFRGSFTAPEPTGKRVLMVCDGDHYQVFLNGKVLVPGKDFAEAQVVDITGDLVRGENVIAAQATDKGRHGGFFVHIGYPSEESPDGYELLASGEGMKCSPHPAKGWQSREFDDSTWTPAHPVAGFDSLVAMTRNFPDVRHASRDVHEFAPPELPGGESLRVEDDGLALVLRQAGGRHTFYVEDSRTQETWFMPGPPFLIDGEVSAWDGSVRCDRVDRGFRVTASGFEKYPGLTLSYTLVLRNRALDVSLDPIQFPSEKNSLSLSFPLDFGAARAGEEGYLVNSYGNYDAREGRIFPFGLAIDRYRDSGELELGGESTMPFFGIVRRGHPCVAIVSDFPAVDFELRTSLGRRSTEGDHLYATTPIWRYERGRVNEPRHITYQFLTKGGYVEVAKAYRRFLVETGRYHTLRQRIERHPICSRSGNASFYWGAPAVGELPAFMAKLKESGVNKAVLHVANRNNFVGGWKRWPNGMTAASGTADEFRNAAEFARKAGYGFSPVDEYTPFAVGGSDYDASLRATTREGGYHEFAKEQCFFLCESQKLRFAQRDLPGVKDVVGECPYLLDCEGCSVYDCHDPRHPVTFREQILARRELLTYVRETMGSVVSEGSPLDAFTDVIDVGHGHSIGFQWWESKPGVFVPLWSLVYAGAVIDLFRVPGAEDGMLYAALYGLNARFDDYKVGTTELEWHKRISDAWPDRNCYELVGHEFVTPLVQKSRFRENDSVVDVVANFGDAEYLYGAHPIPPRDFRVFVGGVTVQE